MRSFIAIEILEDIKDKITEIQQKLKATNADVKWTEPNNIHLTLKFLGEIDDEKLGKIINLLPSVARGCKPFKIEIGGVGKFPPRGIPRIIWVGCKGGLSAIGSLSKSIDECVSDIGIAKEKREFAAHVTIGRVRTSRNATFLNETIEILSGASFGSQIVKKIVLFKSQLGGTAPVYTAIKDFILDVERFSK